MNIQIDTSKGFDVMRGRKVLRHFGNYAEAWAYATGKRGVFVRYWTKKES